MVTFSICGPFEVPTTKMAMGRLVKTTDGKKFWKTYPSVADERGCYVFAFKAGKGYKPVYIGKATKSFKDEVFTPHKLHKFSEALGNQKKGTPMLFLVCLDKTKGPVSKIAIDEAESYLIQAGLAANPNLLNSRKTKVPTWCINGIVRSKQGKPSAAAAAFRRCIKT